MTLSIWIGTAVLLAAGACATASAQGLVEYGAAAAAGSSLGAISGKKVNEGVDTVLQKASETGGKAREMTTSPTPRSGKGLGEIHLYPTAPMAVDGPVPGGGGGAAPAKTAHATTARPQSLQPADGSRRPFPAGPVTMQAVNAPPSRPLPTVEDFSKVATGMSRDEVLQKLGSPSSRIMMSDDGKLVEVYHFIGAGGDLGSVRLVDGTVETVKK